MANTEEDNYFNQRLKDMINTQTAMKKKTVVNEKENQDRVLPI